MQNELRHAEGWTKKNHKYIRKEGNRYIYPEDLKRISQQHANRQAAKNGKLINPTATYRDENGKVALRLHTKGAFATPNQADYKQYSKEMSNQAKQKRAAGNNSQERFGKEGYGFSGNQPSQQSAKWRSNRYKEDSIAEQNAKRRSDKAKVSNMSATEARQISQQRANRKAAANGVKELYRMDNGSYIREYGQPHQEFAKKNGKYRQTQFKRKKALNNQGSVNRQQEAKDFKEYQDWEKADAKKREINSKNQEYAKDKTRKRKAQIESEIRSSIGNQDFAKRNGTINSAKPSKWVKEHGIKPDGSYGAVEGTEWKWTTDPHKHSSESARKRTWHNADQKVKAFDDASRIVSEGKEKGTVKHKISRASEKLREKGKKAISNLKKKKRK